MRTYRARFFRQPSHWSVADVMLAYVVCALLFTLFRECEVTAVATTHEQDEDTCKSVESFCGSANYSARSSVQSFACECGKYHYFNATAKTCYNMNSCAVSPCQHSRCDDNDGKSAARCVCEESSHVNSDCSTKDDFFENCVSSGGKLGVSDNGSDHFKCVCPPGTALEKEMCRSIACLFPNITCAKICADPKLREDSRCCQDWEAGKCDEPHDSRPNCEPGTIWSSETSTCTNVCSAGLAEQVCKHGCKADNERSSNYTCQCLEGQELSADGLSCKKKEQCSDEEIKECAKFGRQCIFQDSKFQCRCYGTALDQDGRCSETCSEEKMRECVGPLSQCTIEGNAERCVCPIPLQWNRNAKQCVPGQEFRYVAKFELYHDALEDNDNKADSCNRTNLSADIEHAMKNLYGLDLIHTKVTDCSNTVMLELTFLNEVCREKLRRIHLCEKRAGTTGCFFPPSLRIIKGSVTGPVPVDLCAEYFKEVHNTSNGLCNCTKEGTRRYVLHCAGGKVPQTISLGFLEIEISHGELTEAAFTTSQPDAEIKITVSERAFTMEVLVVIVVVAVLVCIMALGCLYVYRHCRCKRISHGAPNRDHVTYTKPTEQERQNDEGMTEEDEGM